MSNLAEIKSAAFLLSRGEQEKLLRELAGKLRGERTDTDALSRQRWMANLQELRSSISTGGSRIGSEQILEDLREERT